MCLAIIKVMSAQEEVEVVVVVIVKAAQVGRFLGRKLRNELDCNLRYGVQNCILFPVM